MKCKIPVLIAAKPDRMRDSLEVLLKLKPWINIVSVADDSSSALQMMQEHRPELLLLDINLPGAQVWAVLKQIKALWPQTRCLVLTDNTRQKQEAKIAGTDAVLIKGFKMTEILTVIETFCGEYSSNLSTDNQTTLRQLQPENGNLTRTQLNAVAYPFPTHTDEIKEAANGWGYPSTFFPRHILGMNPVE